MEADTPSIKLTLESTGETVLSEDDDIANLCVDRNGALALQTDTIRRIVNQIVRALNGQYEENTRMQAELDDNAGAIAVLDQTCGDNGKVLRLVQGQLSDLKASFGKQAAKLDTFESKLKQDRDTTAMEASIRKTNDQLKGQKDSMTALNVRMETLDRSVREEVRCISSEVKEMDEQVQRQHEALEDDVEIRLREADETVLSLKLDLEACQVGLTDTNRSKASRAEMEHVNKNLFKVMDSVQKDHATLEEAAANLHRLEECITMSKENKARCEEVSRVFRQEASEIREWAARGNVEVRDKLREKMDRGEAEHQLTELQSKVNKSVTSLSEAIARTEHGMSQKASLSIVQRLQHTVGGIKPSGTMAKQLLVGTSRCIACDREIPQDMVDPNSFDLQNSKQKQGLYQKVQQALSKQQTEGSQDVLRFVAVHVGSPRKLGPFEVRGGGDPALDLGEHALVPSTPPTRPGGAGGAGVGGYGGTGDAGGTPMPPRSQPREVLPVVRVTPRRPGSCGPAVLPLVGTGSLSMRQALGS